jgi:hypothetical protein
MRESGHVPDLPDDVSFWTEERYSFTQPITKQEANVYGNANRIKV